MAWEDITAPSVGEATKKVSFADKVIGNLVYLRANMGGSSSGGGGGNLATNGNFELDGDADGIPDGWDLTEYTAGAFALDETTPGEGARGITFTSPGATGGGDLQSTDFFPVGPAKSLCVDFVHHASVAGIHDLVEIRWYSTALEADYISTSPIYDSTSNPTSKTRFVGYGTPPSTARFAKLKIVGAKNDNATAGVAYFDDVRVVSTTYDPAVVVASGSNSLGYSEYISSVVIDGAGSSPSGGFGIGSVFSVTGAKVNVAGGRSVDVTANDGSGVRLTVSITLPSGLWAIHATAFGIAGNGSDTGGTVGMTVIAIRQTI